MPICNTAAMNHHLNEISSQIAADAHALVILDGASWHRSQGLVVPGNITLLQLPPYSPELTWGDQDQGNFCSRLHDFVLRRVYQIRDPSHST
jgi:DDE superfamily endonuclease